MPSIVPLPDGVADLLRGLAAPPRLVAHLIVVHDVACVLTEALGGAVAFDAEAVRYGAATHDIGKVRHPEELSKPGKRHEATGHAMLLDLGVPERLARFAGSHGSWTSPDATVEDLLVSVADNVWKGKRVDDLEENLTMYLAHSGDLALWDAYRRLDDVLTPIADGGPARLAFQASHPL
jgi:putative nucleotidyltransferase with HDIG domain